MRPTTDYILRKFNEFNNLCFGGKLPPVPMRLSNARTFVGQLACKRRRTLLGGWEYYDYVLKISIRVDLPEHEVEDTILHEMIHYYIRINRLKDTSAHGTLFRQIMDGINKRHNRHITISFKPDEGQREAAVDKRRKLHVLAVAKLDDGRTAIKILPRYRERVLNFRQKVFLIRGVKAVDFYFTDDPFYNRYPVSSVIKLHLISDEELSEHMPTEANRINFS